MLVGTSIRLTGWADGRQENDFNDRIANCVAARASPSPARSRRLPWCRAASRRRALLLAQDDPAQLADHHARPHLQCRRSRRVKSRRRWRPTMSIWRTSFLDLARDRNVAVDPALAAKVEAANSTAGRGRARGRQLRARPDHRRAGRSGRACRHGARRPVRVRRHPRRAARRHAARERRAGRRIDPRACLRRPRHHGRHLCDARRRRAGARRRFGRQGGAPAPAASPRTWRDWLGRSLREVVDWAALKRAVGPASLTEPAVAVRAAARGGQGREGARPGARGQRCRPRAGQGRHAGRARRPQARAGPARRVARRAARRGKGQRTRAILKMLGRGALFLTTSAIQPVLLGVHGAS